jgi:hypothetical protein
MDLGAKIMISGRKITISRSKITISRRNIMISESKELYLASKAKHLVSNGTLVASRESLWSPVLDELVSKKERVRRFQQPSAPFQLGTAPKAGGARSC